MRRELLCVALLAHVPFLLPGKQAPVLENSALRLEMRSSDASIRLLDKKSGVVWMIGPPHILLKHRLTSVETLPAFLAKPAGEITQKGDTISFPAAWGIQFHIKMIDGPAAVEYSFQSGPDVQVEEVQLLHGSLPIGAGEQNYYAIPHRLGVLLPVEGDRPFHRRLRPYEIWFAYSMAMFGAVKNGSALLATWDHYYTDILVDYSVEPRRQLTAGLAVRRSPDSPGLKSASIRLQPLGHGGYVEIAQAYRPIARERGFLKTLAEKLRERPQIEKFFGAADFKLFVYSRLSPNTPWNKTDKEIVRTRYTFSEAAELAEHFRNDLGIDRGLLVLAGWINRGYDNRHPDILPAAPELGGNEGLVECSRRVKALGWLFGLHDNYQDMYRDAPSWNEDYLMKNIDGSLLKGGVWAGGPAYLICSRKALELAARPQNLPRVKELFAPDLYFIDTTLAAPAHQCFDPNHPLTPAGDLHYKQQLCDYARSMFGLFGSEEGREWGVAHADYFEGLMGNLTGYLAARDTDWASSKDFKQIVVPLFELVYGDCIPIYSHQSDRPMPDNPTYILHHILYAEMPVYYFGGARNWTDPAKDFHPKPGSEARLIYARGGRFGLIDQFIKNTYEVLSPLHRATALLPMTDHAFLTSERDVQRTRFGSDVEITVNYGAKDYTAPNATLPQYGFLIESPTFVAFCARRYGKLSYSEPTLFVMRSLDGRPLRDSGKVRIYRGFGDRRVDWNGEILDVEAERVVSDRAD
jgi:hypothetical protein